MKNGLQTVNLEQDPSHALHTSQRSSAYASNASIDGAERFSSGSAGTPKLTLVPLWAQQTGESAEMEQQSWPRFTPQ
jgi:hypothetical protein